MTHTLINCELHALFSLYALAIIILQKLIVYVVTIKYTLQLMNLTVYSTHDNHELTIHLKHRMRFLKDCLSQSPIEIILILVQTHNTVDDFRQRVTNLS